jgi:hypothetical protein
MGAVHFHNASTSHRPLTLTLFHFFFQSLATMAARIFLPFFIGTAVAQTKDILSLWPLLLWHMVSIPASVVISYILARICRLPARETMPFVASCSWGNIGALTFVFMQVRPRYVAVMLLKCP